MNGIDAKALADEVSAEALKAMQFGHNHAVIPNSLARRGIMAGEGQTLWWTDELEAPLLVQVVKARRPANDFYEVCEAKAQKGAGQALASGYDLFLTRLEALVEWQERACAAQRQWAEVLKEAQQEAWGRAMEATEGEEDVEEGLPAVTV